MAAVPELIGRGGFIRLVLSLVTLASGLMQLAIGGMVAVIAILLYRALEARDSTAVVGSDEAR